MNGGEKAASGSQVIAYADKTVLRIEGLRVRGLDTRELERRLMERFGTVVRVIGVTGGAIDMDVYDIDPERILRDEAGVIRTVSATPGVTPTQVARLAGAERIVPVDFERVKLDGRYACARERWLFLDRDGGNPADG